MCVLQSSEWGELRGGFLLYAFFWSLLGLLVIGLVIYMWTHQWSRGTLGHENKREMLMNRVRHSLFWVTYNMAVPLLLSLLRPFTCQQRTAPVIKLSPDGKAIASETLEGKYVMAFDTSQECLTPHHILACVWYGIVAVAFVVGLYFSFFHMVQPQAVYKHR